MSARPSTRPRVAAPLALFANAPDPYLICTPEGVVAEVSEGYLRLSGRPRGELLGRPLVEVTPESGLATLWRQMVERGVALGPLTPIFDGGQLSYVLYRTPTSGTVDPGRVYAAWMQLPAPFALTRGTDHVIQIANAPFLRLAGGRRVLGRPVRDAFPELAGQGFFERMDYCYRAGERFHGRELPATGHFSSRSYIETRYFDLVFEPMRDEHGRIEGLLGLGFDVTELVRARQRAEAAQASQRVLEERMRMALQAAELGTWHCDLPFTELSWDAQVRAHFGVRADARITIEDFYNFLHPEDRDRARDAVERSIAERLEYDIEYRAVAPPDGIAPGTVRWIRARGRAFYDANGHAYRFDGITIDITDKKRAEDALAQARDQLQAIVTAIDESILAQDRYGRIVFANPATLRMFGIGNTDEVTTEPITEIVPRFELRDENGNPLPQDEWPATRAMRGERVSDQVVRIRSPSTGEDHWVLVNSRPICDRHGDVDKVVHVLRDFTVRQRADDARRFLAEVSGVLGASLDYHSTLKMLARLAVPRMADWCAVEMATPDGGSELLAVEHVDPTKVALSWELRRRYPPRAEESAGIAEVMRTGRPQLYGEISEVMLRLAARDNEHFRILRELRLRSALLVPMKSRRGIVGVITLLSAESGRRYSEADLTLAQEVAHRAALAVDNARLYGEAQQAIRVRDDFLSVAGHELRTPMTALQLQLQGLQRLLRRAPSPPSSVVGERLEKAVGHVGRLERLIDELLDVSRIQTGRMMMRWEPVDLGQLAAEVSERFAEESRRARAPIRLEVDAGVIGEWDRLRLDQVLTNLLSNAIKYGAGRPIALSVRGGEDWARVTVRDQGIGISAEDQRRIFGRFERAVSERHYGGLGLGLWIVRQIVEALGGRIEVRSEPGVETVFTVELRRRGSDADDALSP